MQRKFPELKALIAQLGRESNPFADLESGKWQKVSRTSSGNTRQNSEAPALSAEKQVEINEYRAELDAMSETEVDELYRREIAHQRDEDEKARFFHAPHADADFDYWAKMPYWALDEAIALSFGKAPEVVSWKRLENILSYTSPFVAEYRRTRELANRALKWKILYDPVMPLLFLKWSRENDLPFPEALAKKVEANREKRADWKQRYDDLLEKNNNNVITANQIIAEKDRLIAELESKIGEARPLHTKERETLLKLLIGMAVGGYGYDPGASRSATATEISDDLAKEGVSLDTDTVRKWLKEAADVLPRGDLTANE